MKHYKPEKNIRNIRPQKQPKIEITRVENGMIIDAGNETSVLENPTPAEIGCAIMRLMTGVSFVHDED